MASIEWRGGETCRITVSRPKQYGYGYEKLRKTVTFPANLTEKQKLKEAEKAALLFEESIKSGDYLDGEKITLAEFIQIWMREYAEKELAPSTMVNYRMRINKRILPALGHLKLARIQPGHITAFYNNLTEDNIRLDGFFSPTAAMTELLSEKSNSSLKIATGLGRNVFNRLKTGGSVTYETAQKLCAYFGDRRLEELFIHHGKDQNKNLSSKTIKHHHTLLSGIFSLAVEWNLIRDNPVKRVRLPSITKAKSPDVKYYDDEQVTQLLIALEGEPIKYRTILYLALDTGLRLSEIAGLTWQMINFQEKFIHVTKQRQYVSGHGIIEPKPKTASGIRIVTISDMVVNKLKDYLLYQNSMRLAVGTAWQESPFVFTHEDGVPIYPTRPSIWFREFILRKELPHITFHGLRHTNASLLISADVDPVTLAGRLGHAQKNVTLNMYSHMIRSREKAVANKMDIFYENALNAQISANAVDSCNYS